MIPSKKETCKVHVEGENKSTKISMNDLKSELKKAPKINNLSEMSAFSNKIIYKI